MPTATGILNINLDAISSNWRFLSSVTATAEVSAVIKANAYSVGAAVVADELFKQGCRSFFVTTLDEAFEIKNVLTSEAAIYVLGGVRAGDEAIFLQEKFIPVIYSLEMLNRWVNYSANQKLSLPTTIKVDTGMSRFGIQAEEFSQKLSEGFIHKNIDLVLFMSHLACADDKYHALNLVQLNRFKQLVEKVKLIFPRVKTSLANSSGIFLGADWHFDLVRPGAALYGINPQPSDSNPLKQAINLRLPVLQVKKMEMNSSVGYAATASVVKNSRLAIVAGGYADGINRTLGAQPIGICCGEQVESIGRISMDSTIFDVSHLRSSDEEILLSGIEVINESITLDTLVQKNKSLGYEMLTSMGSRYQRCYVRD